MVIEISIAAAALAFIILALFLIMMIKDLRVTLRETNHTLIDIRKQLSEIGFQAQKTMEHANQISFDLKQKIDSVTPIFTAIANVGEILEYQTATIKKECLTSSGQENLFPASEAEKKIISPARSSLAAAGILELVEIGIRLWQKIKKRR